MQEFINKAQDRLPEPKTGNPIRLPGLTIRGNEIQTDQSFDHAGNPVFWIDLIDVKKSGPRFGMF